MAYKSVFPHVLCLVLAPLLAAAQQTSDTDAHLLTAQNAQRNGDYAIAEQEYRAALALKPGYAEVHMNLGLTYQLQARIPEAMAEFSRAVEIKPELLGANLMLGIDHCKRNESTEAIRYLLAVIAMDDHRIEAYSWLATAQEIAGDYEAELITIKHALRVEPANLDLHYLEGHTYEMLGRRSALGVSMFSAHTGLAERLLAESYARSTEWPSAVAHFQHALAASPKQGGLHAELGEVLLRAGKLDQAGVAFDDELHRNPANVRALFGRGKVRLLTGDLDGCLAAWSHALVIDVRYTQHLFTSDDAAIDMPPSSIALDQALNPFRLRLSGDNRLVVHMALVYISRRQGEDASPPAEELWALEAHAPGPPSCTSTTLRIAASSGHVSDVAECTSRDRHSAPTEENRILIAWSLLELGEYERALRALSDIPRIVSNAGELDYLRARCFQELSSSAYVQLYQLDPNSFRVHQLMGDLAAARGDDNKSIEEYRAAIALKPATPNLHYSLAHVLWKNSDIPAARAEYTAELVITPNHIGALHDLGQTFLLEHDAAKALSLLDQAVAAGAKGSDLERDLGTAYAQLSRYREAEAKYKLALINDYDGSIHFKLAAVYRALGEKENATRESAIAANINRKYHLKQEERTPQLKAIVE